MSFFLRADIDHQAHNEEVKRVWEAFYARKPYRVPVSVFGSITNYFLNPELNTHGWSFRDFYEDPEIQIQAQVEYHKWQRFNLICDRGMGLPEDGWPLWVDFQNSYDAGWIGCPFIYWDGFIPDTEPILREHKEKLYELPGELDPTNALMGRAIEFYEYMLEASKTREHEGQAFDSPGSDAG